MNKFKKGDKVRCIDAVKSLTFNKIYTIKEYNSLGNVRLLETKDDQAYFEKRFELVEPVKKVDKKEYRGQKTGWGFE